MPSQIEQADRRVAQLTQEVEALRSKATIAARQLNDPALLRMVLERMVKVMSPGQGSDAIAVAMRLGAAREVLHEFEESVAIVTRLTELKRQIEELRPLTSAESKVE